MELLHKPRENIAHNQRKLSGIDLPMNKNHLQSAYDWERARQP
jgi:hypothetical protein